MEKETVLYEDLAVNFKYKSYNERQSEIFKVKNTKRVENYKDKENYYVYVYMHPGIIGDYLFGTFRFNEMPFYVGKGKYVNGVNYERHFSHLYYDSTKIQNLKHRTIEKIKQTMNRLPIIVKVVDGVDEKTAFDVENLLINEIGRIENSTGVLTNIQRGHKTEWEKIYEKINKKRR